MTCAMEDPRCSCHCNHPTPAAATPGQETARWRLLVEGPVLYRTGEFAASGEWWTDTMWERERRLVSRRQDCEDVQRKAADAARRRSASAPECHPPTSADEFPSYDSMTRRPSIWLAPGRHGITYHPDSIRTHRLLAAPGIHQSSRAPDRIHAAWPLCESLTAHDITTRGGRLYHSRRLTTGPIVEIRTRRSRRRWSLCLRGVGHRAA